MEQAVNQPVRLGVIGTGLAMEKLHWPALSAMPDRFTIAAFADEKQEAGEHFSRLSGLPMALYHRDMHDLLKRDDVEAVLVALPIPFSYPVTQECLAAGKHVICEKPPGIDLDEGRAFLALGTQFPDRVVLVAENFFYRDDLRLARSLLDDGVIGQPHAMSYRSVWPFVPSPGDFASTPWRQQPQYRGGPHLDAGVHHVAQIRLLCGDVQSLHGHIQYANPLMGGPSYLTMNLRFIGGALGNYFAGYPPFQVPRDGNDMRLYGTKGSLVIGNHSIKVVRADGSAEEHRVEGRSGGYYNEFVNFYEGITFGEPVVGNIAQSFLNMEVVMRGLDSAEQGEIVVLRGEADDATLEGGVPLWRPHGAIGLFDGLNTTVGTEHRATE